VQGNITRSQGPRHVLRPFLPSRPRANPLVAHGQVAALSALLLALSGALLALHLATIVLALPGRVRRQGGIGRPPVTLLRPVCGSDPFDPLTLASSFHQNHPDYRVIFCAPGPDDPACDLVNRLISAYPQVPARLLTGEASALRNPKLRNVWKGWQAAEDDWICMSDSNLFLPESYLSDLCDTWGPGTGVVSGPPVGVCPEGAGGHLECAFLNGNQARLQLAVARLGWGFAQGKTLFFNRPQIEAAGGLAALDQHLAEDVATTRLIRATGRTVTLTPALYTQPVGRRSLQQVWDRQLRWAQIRRKGFLPLFLLEPLNGALAALALWGAGMNGAGLPGWTLVVLAMVWYGAEYALVRARGWPAGWRDLAALPLRDMMMPALWLAALTRRGFVWRGHRLDAVPVVPDASICGQSRFG